MPAAAFGQAGEAPGDTPQEIVAGGFDAIGDPIAPAPEGLLQGQIQPEGEVGVQPRRGDGLELGDQLQREAPSPSPGRRRWSR